MGTMPKLLVMVLFVTSGFARVKVLYTIPTVTIYHDAPKQFDLMPYIYGIDREKLKLKISGNNLTEIKCIDGQLSIYSIKDAEGFDVINIEVEGYPKTKFSILLKVMKRDYTVFRYKAPEGVKRVFLAGEFNSWNPNATPMVDDDNDGVYTVSLELTPGSYQYKFVVDGRWITDPENPNRAPDGFGGFNSVIEVKGVDAGKFMSWEKKVDYKTEKAIFKLKYFGKSDLDENSIVVFVNNTRIPAKYADGMLEIQISEIKKHGDFIDLRINGLDLNGEFIEEYLFKEKTHEFAPFDWRDAIIYFVMIDRFYNGDITNDKKIDDPELKDLANYLGGDIRGIIKKIEDRYFDELGINCIWISPFYDNPEIAHEDAFPPYEKFSGYHGYWPKSFYDVEESFGTEKDLIEFVNTAHKHNIKVMFDMIVNHVYIKHPMYKENPKWFSSLDLGYGKRNLRLFDERPFDTWFDVFLPDIDYERNPKAIEYVIRHCTYWIYKTGVDAFRLDAVKHVQDIFWKKLRKELRDRFEVPRNKKIYLVGETISSREKIMEWVGVDELDAQFDFPLYWKIREAFAMEIIGFDKLDKERLASEKIYGKNNLNPVFLGNHDFARFMAYADGDLKYGMNEKLIAFTNPPNVDDPVSYKKLRLAFSFLLSLSCPVLIYYGDEIGLTGAGDPDNRRMMKFKDAWNKHERETYEYVSSLIKLRKEREAIRYGDFIPVKAVGGVYAYFKKYFQDEVLFIINRDNVKRKILFKIPEEIVSKRFKEILYNRKCKVEEGIFIVDIEPKTTLVFVGIQ